MCILRSVFKTHCDGTVGDEEGGSNSIGGLTEDEQCGFIKTLERKLRDEVHAHP